MGELTIVREDLLMPLRRGCRAARYALLFVLLQAATIPICVAAGPPANESPWVATWGTAMVAAGDNAPDISGQTLRLIVHTSLGGRQARVWLSNRFGTTPLRVGAAHIAISQDATPDPSADMSAIRAGSDRVLTFNGEGSVTIAPGATIVSDSLALDVPALANMAVSLYFPEPTLGSTQHGGANQISYAATGDATAAASLGSAAWSKHSWYVLTGVDVYAPGASAVVALGDSITDGNHSTQSANRRWPDVLAQRLAANEATRRAGVLGVVNAGISGNRVLLDGDGPSVMARLEWDVLQRSGVKYLILFEGINDLESAGRDHQPFEELVKHLEAGLAQIALQAHDHGIRVLAATQATDSRDFKVAWPEREAARIALNHWILTTKIFDGTIDFDKTLRDPQCPTQLLEQYNSGDFVHPNDAGYKAMADSIDLNLFTH
jgi:lysophospholipase L1-like esterase